MSNSSIKTDVLIIGSGIAGLFAALKISEFADVVLVTKKDKNESNTNYAQGGIASVISKNDSFDKHIQDTLIAGAGLCNEKMVRIMVEEGPERIKDLIEIGTNFSKKEGHLDLALEGGHSEPRIVHAKDLTGKEIESALVTKVNSLKNIKVIENTIAIDLITEHNIKQLRASTLQNRTCWGAYVLDVKSGSVIKISSKATLLATGGVGQVYQHTTNPQIATGDGIAMSYRAGAKLANMEFIQFHPTSLYKKSSEFFGEQSFLISEAVRGFGGKLLTRNGFEFMSKYDERKELAPRDIVARAIDSELKKSGEEFVLLDITHKNSDEIKSHFPNIYEHCLKLGVDITKDPIPVVPAAHYSCGGVKVDEFARTSLKGLYACGEVTMTGVHGANRLASNSLLEAVVFADRVALDLKMFLKEQQDIFSEIPDWDDSGTLTADENVLISHNYKEVKTTMWDYVSIVRSNQRLERAAKRIHIIYEEVEDFYKRTKVFSELLELRNLVACAHIIIKSALQRKESRGLHFTLDYPDLSENAEDTIIQNVNP
ncbi:MAG: L-aspartate oxidase [Ignavibacteriaceae bacterium]|nr:L-aspartate oxidase [Ignavibacteriaceae bacterium]